MPAKKEERNNEETHLIKLSQLNEVNSTSSEPETIKKCSNNSRDHAQDEDQNLIQVANRHACFEEGERTPVSHKKYIENYEHDGGNDYVHDQFMTPKNPRLSTASTSSYKTPTHSANKTETNSSPYKRESGGGEEKNSLSFLNLFSKWTPNSIVFRLFIYTFLPLIIWLSAFLLFGSAALPGGPLFPLIVLECAGIALGMAVEGLRLPPLLGMLAMGILFRNVPVIDFGKTINESISSPIRQMALVVILIRAGLGLDPSVLLRLKSVVFLLAFSPCLFEILTIGLVSHFILSFPWAWAFLLGTVLSAVSPAVVVPCLLNLAGRGYGVGKGIPTIVIAAASVDDILAISLFGVTLSLALTTSTESVFESLLQGPLELVIGILFGIGWGLLIGLFLVGNTKADFKNLTMLRVIFLLCGGTLSIFGSQYIEYPGAGALACLTSSFIASLMWRNKNTLEDGDMLCWTFAVLWYLFQPLLFGLIGCEINLNSIEIKIVGLGILCIFIGIIIRLAVTFLAVSNSGLNFKEKIFVSIAWLPKATVQAAIGPVALDTVRKLGCGRESEELGLQVLTIAVLSILITAPIGAALIMALGPKLLAIQQNHDSKRTEEELIN